MFSECRRWSSGCQGDIFGHRFSGEPCMADPATVFLLVTWLANGKPPDSYQIEFPTPRACETARSELAGRAKAIIEWVADRKAELAAQGGTNTKLFRSIAAAEPIKLSAECASHSNPANGTLRQSATCVGESNDAIGKHEGHRYSADGKIELCDPSG
jgi:hypothetical protein